jgi:hypothetical protein
MSAVRCNVTVSRYDGDVMFGYDCVRSGRCKFGLYPSMPPDPDMQCAFYQGGSCLQQAAQLAALVNLKSDINAEIKRLEAEAKEAS